MRRLLCIAAAVIGLSSLSGCVVYDPRPRVYVYPDYDVYPGPTVVYYHSYYGGGYYYHRGYCR